MVRVLTGTLTKVRNCLNLQISLLISTFTELFFAASMPYNDKLKSKTAIFPLPNHYLFYQIKTGNECRYKALICRILAKIKCCI